MLAFTRARRAARRASTPPSVSGVRPVVVLSGLGTVIEYRPRNRTTIARAMKSGPQQWLVVGAAGRGVHRHEADIIDDIDPAYPVRELLHGLAA